MLAGQQNDDAPVAASHGLTTSEVEDTKLMVTDEPDAGIPHVRVCGGDGGKPPSLPGKYFSTDGTDMNG